MKSVPTNLPFPLLYGSVDLTLTSELISNLISYKPENFVFTERLKLHTLNNDFARIYFWRTSDRRPRELDFIEVVDGKMTAIECKMSKEEVAKPGDAFVAAYPECPIHTISPVDVMNLWTI